MAKRGGSNGPPSFCLAPGMAESAPDPKTKSLVALFGIEIEAM